MTYFVESEKYGRTQVEFDSKRFLADLVSALGGTNPDPEYQGGKFDLDDLTIYLRQGYGAKVRRVAVFSGIADRAAHRRAYARGGVPKFPSISIDPDRPLDALVKDIRRRLVDASAEAVAALKAADAAQADTFEVLKTAAADLNAKFPGVATVGDDDTKRNAPIYFNVKGGTYLSGTLNSDGGLYVERVGTIPPHKVAALLTLLASGGES